MPYHRVRTGTGALVARWAVTPISIHAETFHTITEQTRLGHAAIHTYMQSDNNTYTQPYIMNFIQTAGTHACVHSYARQQFGVGGRAAAVR